MTKYKTILEDKAENFNHAVKEAIHFGWIPVGAATCDPHGNWFLLMMKND